MLRENICLKEKRVILRTDYNVPIINNKIQSTKRIDESLKTIKFILDKEPKKLIIISHLGRPNGKDKNLSLLPIKEYLNMKLATNITLLDLDELTKNTIEKCKIIMLENIRFYKEETEMTSKTENFRKQLSNLGDVYINDAFGCCHREHSSIVGINTREKYLGILIEKEIKYLENSLSNNTKKALILGGSKIKDKIKLIKNLIPKVDKILIGGAMTFTFLNYQGIKIGKSLIDKDSYPSVEEIIDYAKKNKTEIILPVDFNCNERFDNIGNIQNFDIEEGIPDNYMGLDIGIKTIELFKKSLYDCETIIWNGPLGVFEFENFSRGSQEILLYLSIMWRENKTTIIGGGDIVSCCEKYNLQDQMTHVSTGGGASLELLEGKLLPGIHFITKT